MKSPSRPHPIRRTPNSVIRQFPVPPVWTRCAVASFLAGVLACGNPAAVRAAVALADLTIEQLMNIPVTSVSKKETKLSDSAAAISVISAEDIRRLGITSFPEALRLVPGLDVARITGNGWAISSRGFNSQYARMLLVLVDGRTVYSPAGASVPWNVQDLPMEDVERIEVIRGPGATLWGANAVNGVINLTTKSAKDTQGGMISLGAGTEDRPSVTVRYGGQPAPDLYYRVYAKYFNRDGLVDPTGKPAPDDWHSLQVGFRTDWFPSPVNTVTIQGDAYRGRAEERVGLLTLAPAAVTPSTHDGLNRGSNLLGRWTHGFEGDAMLTVQAYYDHVAHAYGESTEYRDAFDLDLQYRRTLAGRHELVLGAGYRDTGTESVTTDIVVWTPPKAGLQLFNFFAQDEIVLAPDRLTFTVGSKFEHNNLNGGTLLPNARLRWNPAPKQTVWAAVSRASRTPSLFERNARLNVAAFQPAPTGPAILVSQFGNPQIEAENLTAYELGWRAEPLPQLSLDLTAFRQDYDHLISVVDDPARFETSPSPAHLLIPSTQQNAQTGRVHGAELSVQWQPTTSWRWVGSYTWLNMRLLPNAAAESDSPQHQFQIRSYLDLPRHWELNGAAYYVGAVKPQAGPSRVRVPAYTRADLGLVWRPTDALELGLWGQNLIGRRHQEYPVIVSPVLTEVPRGFEAKLSWKF